MDPLIHLLTQTQRAQLDNVQRSSEQLRTQQDRELKRKRARAGEVDLSDLSGDIANDMGEDLLGSMDPDLFGRSSGTEAFKKSWEEALEDESESEDDSSEEGEQEEDSSEEEAQPEAAPPGLEEHRDGGWRPVVEEAPAAAEPPVADPAADAPASPESRSEGAPPRAQERHPSAPPPDVAELRSSERTALGEWQSLLDHGVGFILAEETAPAPEAQPEPSQELEPVAPQLADVLGRLISGDAHSVSYRKLQHLLARFGLGVLRRCAQEGVQVHLLPRGESLAFHPVVASLLTEPDVVGALYVPSKRWCLVEEEGLLETPRHFHPALTCFAHAFDHAIGDEGFASLKSAAVTASFQACEQGLEGHSFADSLARQSPVRYFAQAVESYLSQSDSLEPLWTKDDLFDFDRSMYEYVEYLLTRINRGS